MTTLILKRAQQAGPRASGTMTSTTCLPMAKWSAGCVRGNFWLGLLPPRNTTAENRRVVLRCLIRARSLCDVVERRGATSGVIMRQITIALLASTALFAGLAESASAADMRAAPYRPPAPPPAPIYFSWSGCYVGGHVGGIWTRKDWFVRDPAFASFGQSDGSHDADGFIGGVQGGCEYQFAGGWG